MCLKEATFIVKDEETLVPKNLLRVKIADLMNELKDLVESDQIQSIQLLNGLIDLRKQIVGIGSGDYVHHSNISVEFSSPLRKRKKKKQDTRIQNRKKPAK